MGFIIRLEGRSENEGHFVSYWHTGDHLGACIVEAIDDARDLGFESLRPDSVVEFAEFTDHDWIRLSKTLYRSPTTKGVSVNN